MPCNYFTVARYSSTEWKLFFHQSAVSKVLYKVVEVDFFLFYIQKISLFISIIYYTMYILELTKIIYYINIYIWRKIYFNFHFFWWYIIKEKVKIQKYALASLCGLALRVLLNSCRAVGHGPAAHGQGQPRNHGIPEWLGFEGTLRITQSQFPGMGRVSVTGIKTMMAKRRDFAAER